jgi:hypothetical protein
MRFSGLTRVPRTISDLFRVFLYCSLLVCSCELFRLGLGLNDGFEWGGELCGHGEAVVVGEVMVQLALLCDQVMISK